MCISHDVFSIMVSVVVLFGDLLLYCAIESINIMKSLGILYDANL